MTALGSVLALTAMTRVARPRLRVRLQQHAPVELRDDQEDRPKLGREGRGDARSAEQGTAGVGEASIYRKELGHPQVYDSAIVAHA